MSKRKDAIWARVVMLAQLLEQEFEKGHTVMCDNNVLHAPFVLDLENQHLKEVNGNCVHYIHNGTDEGWGAFETLTEVNEFFSKRIKVLQPMEWVHK